MIGRGQRIELTLDSMAYGGDAVGRYRGMAVFVPYGLPGERVRVWVAETRKTFCRAVMVEVLEASDHRAVPKCPVFGRCGGCQWQMADYPHQLELKRRVLVETLKRLGGLAVPEIGVIGHSSGWAYRNKAQFPVAASGKGLETGYYERQSHRVVAAASCPILEPALSAAWAETRRVVSASGMTGYDEKKHAGQLRHLVLRSSRSGGSAMLALVTRTPDLPEGLVESLAISTPLISSICQNLNPNPGNTILGRSWVGLWGTPYLEEELSGVRLRVSPGSFLQVNLEVTEGIYAAIVEGLELDGSERVLDVYSGVGSIALMLSRRAREVVGIEEAGPAVDDAEAGAGMNGIVNCRFLRGRAEDLLEGSGPCQAMVLDPPRQGLRPEALAAVGRLSPGRIAYLSCNPATLARDLAALAGFGYRLRRLWMADMFPQTYHIETLALIRKEGP